MVPVLEQTEIFETLAPVEAYDEPNEKNKRRERILRLRSATRRSVMELLQQVLRLPDVVIFA